MYIGKKKVMPVFRHIIYKEKQPAPNGEFYLKVFDFYGNELISKRLNNGDVFVLPDPIEDDKLEFQEWSSTEQIIDGKITIDNNNVLIGAIGTPKSGLSEFDIETNKNTGNLVTCKMVGNKNWGDGTIDDSTSHEYAEYGKYTITCDGNALTALMFNSNGSSGNVAVNVLKRVRISDIVTTKATGNYIFGYSRSLESITFPKNFVFESQYGLYETSINCLILPSISTKVAQGCCSGCKSMLFALIPYGATYPTYQTSFYECNSMTYFVAPNTVMSNVSYANDFQGFYGVDEFVFNGNKIYISSWRSLRKLTLSENLTNLYINGENNLEIIEFPPNSNLSQQLSFYSSRLKKIKLPKTIGVKLSSTINNNTNPSLEIIDFSLVESIPTLSSSSGLVVSPKPFLKIVVPDALYDEWIVATNWSVQAQYIYKASEVEL